MCQHIGPGGAFADAGRRLQSDYAFQPLEGEFDPPAQAVKGEYIRRRISLLAQRGDKDHPVRSGGRALRDGVAFPLGIAPGLAPRRSGCFLTAISRSPGAGAPLRPVQTGRPVCPSAAPFSSSARRPGGSPSASSQRKGFQPARTTIPAPAPVTAAIRSGWA